MICDLSQSYYSSTKGNLVQGNYLGNCSLILITSGLISGLVWLFISSLVVVLVIAHWAYCGLATRPAGRSYVLIFKPTNIYMFVNMYFNNANKSFLS